MIAVRLRDRHAIEEILLFDLARADRDLHDSLGKLGLRIGAQCFPCPAARSLPSLPLPPLNAAANPRPQAHAQRKHVVVGVLSMLLGTPAPLQTSSMPAHSRTRCRPAFEARVHLPVRDPGPVAGLPESESPWGASPGAKVTAGEPDRWPANGVRRLVSDSGRDAGAGPAGPAVC